MQRASIEGSSNTEGVECWKIFAAATAAKREEQMKEVSRGRDVYTDNREFKA